MPFSTLKRLGTSLLRPAAPATVNEETLFPVVSKEEDGDDCDHDCDACPGYGRTFDKMGVDADDKLFGNITGYATHAVVATGETDWIRDVEEIKGSFMEALAKKYELVTNGRMMISASNLPPPHEYFTAKDDKRPQPTSVILLPSFTVLESVTPDDATEVITKFVNTGPTTKAPLAAESTAESDAPAESEKTAETTEAAVSDQLANLALSPSALAPRTLATHPYPHDYLILLCSHRYRDARCGISAPILRKEFEKHLRSLGLWRDLTDKRPGGASVVFINHVGGHKYAANVLIYRKQDGQGMWLARVSPKHVEGIVKHTIIKGKIVHPEQIRGGFDRSRGVASW